MTTIKLRRGNSWEWTAVNPILAAGEKGIELDTGREKVGNGTKTWAELEYLLPQSAIQAMIDQAIDDFEMSGEVTTLDNLTDVNAPAPADGDALVWDAATSLWIPSPAVGVPGPQGPPGTAYLNAQWNFNQNTAVSPASGTMRMNATTYAATTTLWVSETDRDGLDRTAGLNLVAAGDQIIMQSAQGRVVWTVTDQADSGTYRTFTVTPSEISGNRPSASSVTTLYFASFTDEGDEGGPEPATGGIVQDVGAYRIHTFNESTSMVFPSNMLVDVLLVGGGGGGGYHRGGGGGAGGFLVQPGVAVAAGTYSIVIGQGGAVVTDADGNNGQNTTAFGFTALGGGGGGNVPRDGKAGGSGGGGSATNNEGTNAGGAGTAGQGYAGGTHTTNDGSAGGGGAGGTGQGGGIVADGGLGGAGLQSSYSGTAKWYAGGGGGGGRNTGAAGGSGIGGVGAGSGASQVAPIPNTGSGGAGRFDGGASTPGASGVVVVRYEYAPEVALGGGYIGAWSASVDYPAGSVVTYGGKTWGAASAVAAGQSPPVAASTTSVIPAGTNMIADAPTIVIVTDGDSASSPLFNVATFGGEVGEPGGAPATYYSAWLKYTPLTSGTVTFTTLGSTGDSTLSMYRYTGSGGVISFTELTLVAGNDDSAGGGDALITQAVTGGTTYYFQMSGYSAQSIQFNITNGKATATPVYAWTQLAVSVTAPVLVLGPATPIPGGTAAGTVIVRTVT